MKLSIVSYLDDEATKQVRTVQYELYETTGSTASLTSWEPHITIGDGIVIDKSHLKDVVDELTGCCKTATAFTLKINNWGGITNRSGGNSEDTTPYSLFYNVESKPELKKLVGTIQMQLTTKYPLWWKMRQPFSPHITLAFRDLERDGYEKGVEFLKSKSINLNTKIEHVSLVEKLDKVDREVARIPLSAKPY